MLIPKKSLNDVPRIELKKTQLQFYRGMPMEFHSVVLNFGNTAYSFHAQIILDSTKARIETIRDSIIGSEPKSTTKVLTTGNEYPIDTIFANEVTENYIQWHEQRNENLYFLVAISYQDTDDEGYRVIRGFILPKLKDPNDDELIELSELRYPKD